MINEKSVLPQLMPHTLQRIVHNLGGGLEPLCDIGVAMAAEIEMKDVPFQPGESVFDFAFQLADVFP